MYFSVDRILHFIEEEKTTCCHSLQKTIQYLQCQHLNLLKKIIHLEYNPSEWQILSTVHNVACNSQSLKLFQITQQILLCSNCSLKENERRVHGHLFSHRKDQLPRASVDDCVDLKWLIFFFVNRVAIQSILASSTCRIIEPNMNIGQGNIWWLESKMEQYHRQPRAKQQTITVSFFSPLS